MLVEEIDPIGLEPLQRCVGDFADVRRSAVESGLLAVLELEPELRRDHDLIANGRERFADELFVRERPVGFGRVEERDAAVDGGANDREALVTTGGWPVAEADAHAPEAECRHLQPILTECAPLHISPPPTRSVTNETRYGED